MEKVSKVISKAVEGVCPECEVEGRLNEMIVTSHFDYGVGEDAVKLTATIPVLNCGECGNTHTDHRAESIRHRIICELFGEPASPRVILNEGHFHEVTHVAHLLNCLFEDQILSHPAVVQTPVLFEAANKVGETLANFYQDAANAWHQFDEAKNEQNKGN